MINPLTGEEIELDPLTGQPIENTPIEAPIAAPVSAPTVDPREYLMQKYNLGQYGDEGRIAAQEQTKLDWGDKTSAALMALGAGLQGRDSGQAAASRLSQLQGQRNQTLDQFEKGRAGKIQEYGLARDLTKQDREDAAYRSQQDLKSQMADPNSQRSKDAAAEAIALGVDPKMVQGRTAEEIEGKSKYITMLLDKKAREQEQANKDRTFSLQKGELDLKGQELAAKSAKAGTASTEGQKAVDKDYAKQYNDWTSGGRIKAESEINKLNAVVKRMEEGKGTTGGLTGVLGDRLTSEDVLKNRADVMSSAMALIKQNLSGATSDKDVERTVKTLWNEADTTANNIARINRFVKDTESRMNEQDSKSKFYEEHGTLSGFKGATPAPTAADKSERKEVKRQRSPSTGKTRIVYDDGTTKEI